MPRELNYFCCLVLTWPSGSQLEILKCSRGHLVMSRDILGCHDVGLLLVSIEGKLRITLDILQDKTAPETQIIWPQMSIMSKLRHLEITLSSLPTLSVPHYAPLPSCSLWQIATILSILHYVICLHFFFYRTETIWYYLI